MSCTGMCSVMQTIVPMPASAASSTAAAANRAGTKTRLASAPVASTHPGRRRTPECPRPPARPCRRDARDDVRAVGTVAQPVEATLATGQSLNEEPRALVDEDAHAGRASSAIRSSATQPSRMCGAISSRTRFASSPVQAVRASHGSSSIGKSNVPHLLDGEPCVGEEAAPLGLVVVAHVGRVAEALASSESSPC